MPTHPRRAGSPHRPGRSCGPGAHHHAAPRDRRCPGRAPRSSGRRAVPSAQSVRCPSISVDRRRGRRPRPMPRPACPRRAPRSGRRCTRGHESRGRRAARARPRSIRSSYRTTGSAGPPRSPRRAWCRCGEAGLVAGRTRGQRYEGGPDQDARNHDREVTSGASLLVGGRADSVGSKAFTVSIAPTEHVRCHAPLGRRRHRISVHPVAPHSPLRRVPRVSAPIRSPRVGS